jgi:vitamin B12 transporter
MSLKKRPLWAAALTLSISLSAQGSETLETLVITADRMPQTPADTLTPVSLITREDIERLQPRSMAELLERTPGIVLARDGGAGQKTSLFLRGTESDHTLVLLNGVRVNEPTSGTARFYFIDPALVERIEVIRGPRSSLYGASALGGVINIITRTGPPSQGTDSGGRASVRVGVGSNSLARSSASIQLAHNNSWLTAGLVNTDTQGIDATLDTTGTMTDNDAWRHMSLFMSAGHRSTGGTEATAQLVRQSGTIEYDEQQLDPLTYAPLPEQRLRPYGNYRQTSLSSRLTLPWHDDADTEFNLGMTEDRYDTRDDAGIMDTSDMTTRNWHADWLNRWYVSDQLSLSQGIEFVREDIRQREINGQDSPVMDGQGHHINQRDSLAAFVYGDWRYADRWHSTASVRFDDIEDAGQAWTGNLAQGVDLTPALRLTASLGTAFRAPSFQDLYNIAFPGQGYPSTGNPDLEPEEAFNKELELRGTHEGLRWSVNLFQNDIDELIDYDPVNFTPVNTGKARIRGSETALSWQPLSRLMLAGQWTWLDARDGDGDRLLRRPRHSLTLDADYQLTEHLDVGAGLMVQSSRPDVDYYQFNIIEVPGYGRLDARTKWKLTETVALSLDIHNLLDKDYVQVDGFRTSSREYSLTASYTPEFNW